MRLYLVIFLYIFVQQQTKSVSVCICIKSLQYIYMLISLLKLPCQSLSFSCTLSTCLSCINCSCIPWHSLLNLLFCSYKSIKPEWRQPPLLRQLRAQCQLFEQLRSAFCSLAPVRSACSCRCEASEEKEEKERAQAADRSANNSQ